MRLQTDKTWENHLAYAHLCYTYTIGNKTSVKCTENSTQVHNHHHHQVMWYKSFPYKYVWYSHTNVKDLMIWKSKQRAIEWTMLRWKNLSFRKEMINSLKGWQSFIANTHSFDENTTKSSNFNFEMRIN